MHSRGTGGGKVGLAPSPLLNDIYDGRRQVRVKVGVGVSAGVGDGGVGGGGGVGVLPTCSHWSTPVLVCLSV